MNEAKTTEQESKRHGRCKQDRRCPLCGVRTCKYCSRKNGTCDNHTQDEILRELYSASYGDVCV